MPAHKLMPPDLKVLKLHLAGHSAQKLAERYKVQEGTIVGALKRTPEWPRLKALRKENRDYRKKWKDKNLHQLVIQTYQEVCSLARTAKRFGTKNSVVKRILLEYGKSVLTQSQAQSGSWNPSWNGGRSGGNGEYVSIYCPDHPRAKKRGSCYVLEHHLVMEKKIGRYLKPGEVVHHKNKKKDDNRLENLELFASNAEHLAKELKGQCPKWTEEGRRNILKAVRSPKGPMSEKNKEAIRKAMKSPEVREKCQKGGREAHRLLKARKLSRNSTHPKNDGLQ